MNETNAHPIPAEWLSAYCDGELDPLRRQQVDAHLPGCAECQRELAELEALRQALSAGALPDGALTPATAFWHTVEQRLPDRLASRLATTPARVDLGGLVLRWVPGLGLLALNGIVQAAAVVSTFLILVVPQFSSAPAWTPWADRLAASLSLGSLAWLVPVSWSGLGIFSFCVTVSGGLGIVYLAWLAYELRYGAQTAPSAAA